MAQAARAPAGPVLVRTKLHPPLPRGGVARPGLVAALEREPPPRLALLRAPAGAGKTTLLAEWAASARRARRFAWLALDPADNDPRRFWTYAVESLRSAAPGIGDTALELLPVPGAGIEEDVLPALIDDLAALRTPIVLALDDYHVIREAAVHDSLSFLLEHARPTLELAIASRTEPPLPIARLRARGELAEVDAMGLRFSAAEAEEMLNGVLGLDLTSDDVSRLCERTEGWAAGLYLAALSLRGRDRASDFVADFAGDDRHVVDYLAEEVLAEQAEDLRDFLLRTSILERLCAPLCDVVLERDDSGRRLAEIERANLMLVPLDERREWYRYHHLFGDLLRLELERTASDQLSALHRRAAAWHREAGLVDQAIRHTVAAGDLEDAAELIAAHYNPAIQHGAAATADRWLTSLPEATVRADARLCLARAVTSMAMGRHGEVGAWIDAAEAATAPGPFRDGTTSLQSGAAVVRCMLYMHVGAFAEGVPQAQRARELEALDSPWRGVALAVEGICRCWRGDFAGAEPLMREAIELTRRLGVQTMPIVYSLGNRSFMAAESGDWQAAETLAREALAVAAESGTTEHWVCGVSHVVLGRVPGHDPQESERSIERGITLARRGAGPVQVAHALLARSARARADGDPEAARRALEEARSLAASCPDPGILPRLLDRAEPRASAASGIEDLSERELAVLRLLPTALSQREIGNELYVSLNTVKTHTRAIFRKLGVAGREDAVARARDAGLL